MESLRFRLEVLAIVLKISLPSSSMRSRDITAV